MSKRKENIDKKELITKVITFMIVICLLCLIDTIYKRENNSINQNYDIEQNSSNIEQNQIYNIQQNSNNAEQNETTINEPQSTIGTNYNLPNIPNYTDKIWIEINNNIPYFTDEDKKKGAFEEYSNLDEKERCGVAFANICKEIMPKEGQKREEISRIKPSGWKQTLIDGKYLYNRCHLIAYQLADESANEKNLITGTRYFNTEGMLPFENKVADYIKQNENNHVLYRVTPDFKGDNLVASGVQIEAYSIEDNGEGIQFNVYIYNAQPGVDIDYLTGDANKIDN